MHLFLSLDAHLMWVGLLVPLDHVVSSLVVLFEANKVLEHNHSTSVIEVMTWNALVALQSLSHSCSITLDLDLLDSVRSEHKTKNHLEPVVSVLSVVVISIIVHWISWLGSLEVCLVRAHEVLEHGGVFGIDSGRIGMLVVQEVVHPW